MSTLSSYLKYKEYGDPLQVIEKGEKQVCAPENNQILVKMLVAPINPADINTIQGILQKSTLIKKKRSQILLFLF